MSRSNSTYNLAATTITAVFVSSVSSLANDEYCITDPALDHALQNAPSAYITDPALQNAPSTYIASLTSATPSSQWHHELKQRIDKLSNHQDGWKGPESIAPNADATRYANEFLEQLVNVNIKNQPMVGLDYEGTFSFCWNDDQVSGDLTVYDNGTYSFFISNNRGRTASAEEDRIGDPLNTVFLEILNS